MHWFWVQPQHTNNLVRTQICGVPDVLLLHIHSRVQLLSNMTKEGSNVGAQISPEKLALNFVYGKRAHLKAYEPRFWTLFLNIHRHKDRIFRLTPAAFVQHFLTVIVKDIQTKDIPDNRKEYFAKHFPERSMAGRYLDECKRRRCKQTIFYRYINYMLYITSRGNL